MLFGRRPGPISWLVVFLGNPGPKYRGTRHNVGFMTADVVEQTTGRRIDRLKYKSLTRDAVMGGEKVLLMKPQTYMNLSGDAVRQAMDFYKVPTDHIIVVSDETALPPGKIRVRGRGSAGGHNGLKDIIAKCGGEGFPRIRIGVGAPPNPEYDLADWVLGTFSGKDAELVEEAVKRAAAAVEAIIADGVDRAMSRYN